MESWKLEKEKPKSAILWVGFLIVDVFLHKTTQLEILKNLARLGHKVDLFALYSKEKTLSYHKDIKLSLVPLRYAPALTAFFFAIVVMMYLPLYVVKKRPRYIIVEPDLTVLVFLWKPLLNCLQAKLILDIRSTPVEVINFRKYLSALWFNVSVIAGKKAFDGMTILTLRMKKELCEDFQIQPEHIGVWTSGVSTEIYMAEKYDRDELRKKLSWTDKLVVMYHGRLDPHRGIFESIQAVKIAKDQNIRVLLFILGSGPIIASCKKLAREIGVEEDVVFHTPVPYEKVPEFIAASDVGLVALPNLAMWRNQSPLKLLEYLAMKKVTIVTDIPMIRDVIGESKCGVYIPSTDPQEIGKVMVYLYENREKLSEWGKFGRKIVEERFDWRKVAEDFESYLLQLN
ncbi:MAG: glycosyltransferase family 4 protein [Promethearchaeota archaeon]